MNRSASARDPNEFARSLLNWALYKISSSSNGSDCETCGASRPPLPPLPPPPGAVSSVAPSPLVGLRGRAEDSMRGESAYMLVSAARAS